MRKKTTKNNEQKVAAQVESTDLDERAQSALEVAHLKAESAQNAAAARKAELENLLLQVRARYEENGKYTVLQIDAGTKKVHRVLTASMPKQGEQPFREPAREASSGGDQPQG